MSQRTSYPPGTFSWVDLSTSDPQAAKAFYGKLFGWEAVDMPAGEAGVYTMLRLHGDDVAALSEQTEQERSMGIPPHWNSYITVEDVDASAKRARSLGATIIAAPFDVLDAGRMAVVQDPTGAMFSIWQPRDHIGARRVNEPGAFTWNDLATTDAGAARDFYTGLFGWDASTLDAGPISYTTWKVGGRSNGGMMELTGDQAGVFPHWMPYFGVESVGETARTAEGLGARVLFGPMEVPAGRFVTLQDPQGAAFSLFEGEYDD